MRILVTGATGFVGKPVCAALAAAGHELRVLARRPDAARESLPAGSEIRPVPAVAAVVGPEVEAAWRDVVSGCDAVVNLAGEPIAGGRWTDARKQELRRSRIDLTRCLVAGIRAADPRPRVLVSASAIGFYGPRGDEPVDERTAPGDGFLADLCVDWEREAARAEESGVRVVLARLGVVLGKDGGALARMVPPFKLFAGGPIGAGNQVLSWVHLDDVVGLILHALQQEGVHGPMNVTAPDARSSREFSRALGAALGRPSWFPTPAPVLHLALGEMAEMLLTGQRVVPVVAEQSGYSFRYARLEGALRAAL